MIRDKRIFRFYLFVSTGLLVGWLWLGLAANTPENSLSVCYFKNVFGIPCPSCGATHSVLALAKGAWLAALEYNIVGYLLAFLLIFLPLALLVDVITTKARLYYFWHRGETYLRRHPLQLILVLSPIFLNWFWKLTQQ